MTRIMIDTNIFLSLYESKEDPEEIFRDIMKVRASPVLPDVIFDEYLRNRDRALGSRARRIRNAAVPEDEMPDFLVQSPEYCRLQQRAGEYNRSIRDLVADIQMMIADPAGDPIFAALSRLYADPETTTLRWTRAHFERASQRKIIGNPPKSERKDMIGDELIREMVPDHMHEDLILITRDMMYRNPITYVRREYQERTGSRLMVDERLSSALRQMGEEPSLALLRFEEESSGPTE
ncbi:PIN domain-containing protein [Methanofollis sp.]|uniref:PIN domain-containing protein n=1 Tax=Methanofollis sp. TaxID=2052835 RepID=UPI002620FE2F|nr:PIN domain-containing protein [Methanofollis sp.]